MDDKNNEVLQEAVEKVETMVSYLPLKEGLKIFGAGIIGAIVGSAIYDGCKKLLSKKAEKQIVKEEELFEEDFDDPS